MKPTSSVITTMLAALLVPFFSKHLGIKLSAEDVSALIAAVLTLAHAAVPYVKAYFPHLLPPVPPDKE